MYNYNKDYLKLASIRDENTVSKTYLNDILKMCQKEYYLRHIDFYTYERLINIIQVMKIQQGRIDDGLKDLISRAFTATGRLGQIIDIKS